MMAAPSPVPPPLQGRVGRVKGWALRLMFVGGGLGALLTLLLPTHQAPDLWAGRVLFLLTALCGLGAAALTWRQPGVLRSERFDTLFMLLGNFCTLTSALGETLLFGSHFAAQVALWPMVFAAGFLSRALLRWQVALSLLTLGLLASTRQLLLPGAERWWLEAVVQAVPVVVTGLTVSFFRRAAEDEAQELLHLGRTDPLTGLLNRRALHAEFEGSLTRVPAGHRVAVVMLDLDHFKAINDRHGHRVGDEVLRCFAGVLRAHADTHDLLVRVGGEEFVWLTAGPTLEGVLHRVEQARAAHTAHPDGRAVTVSAGVAHGEVAEVEGSHLQLLLDRADAALYAAKAAGRNGVQVHGLAAP
ncbi:GGDEF domain-containing protein [Deinococcus sp. HMF7604]|uniref:GGDEF domain-containing protein n=1 Tax=Deinococcus betulae TaxID=2873312 RepID=UPI001CCC7CB0|nr:GGDEF domain-containing protein [Deinococcus betulae]MBZ9751866.1 GGDEF domain-containing protein [Deinococcus betulae]